MGSQIVLSQGAGSRAEPAVVNVLTAGHLMLDNVGEHQARGVEGRCRLSSSDHNTQFHLSVLLQVGFFPSECVELTNDKVPQSVTNSVPKPGV